MHHTHVIYHCYYCYNICIYSFTRICALAIHLRGWPADTSCNEKSFKKKGLAGHDDNIVQYKREKNRRYRDSVSCVRTKITTILYVYKAYMTYYIYLYNNITCEYSDFVIGVPPRRRSVFENRIILTIHNIIFYIYNILLSYIIRIYRGGTHNGVYLRGCSLEPVLFFFFTRSIVLALYVYVLLLLFRRPFSKTHSAAPSTAHKSLRGDDDGRFLFVLRFFFIYNIFSTQIKPVFGLWKFWKEINVIDIRRAVVEGLWQTRIQKQQQQQLTSTAPRVSQHTSLCCIILYGYAAYIF